jgi:oligopeptide transport system substrate-binding protein
VVLLNFVSKLFLISFMSLSVTQAANDRVFRFHLSQEPMTLDPTQQKGSGAFFLLNSLSLPLFMSDFSNHFKPGVFKSCRWHDKLNLTCRLQENRKWSNGKLIVADDVVRTFNHFQNSTTQSLRLDLVKNLKKVTANSQNEVAFELLVPEPRFQERLTSPLLGPIQNTQFPVGAEANQLITSGPYKIDKWESKRKITLSMNHYFNGHPRRPGIEIFFVPEDTTALMLYEKGQLDFLRRFPSAYFKAYETKADFVLAPLTRFDYVGFGPSMDQQSELRRILSESLQFDDWKKVLRARGRPGCFGIGRDLINSDPCLEFAPQKLAFWKKELISKPIPPIELHYSTLGGEDHKRSMEWLQNEWKKNLGIHIPIKGIENALFQREMIEAPPSLFRFGVALDHLSCANALKNFVGIPDRPLPFKQPQLLTNIKTLSAQDPSSSEEEGCRQALSLLLDNHWIIPLGRIHIGLLAKPEWKGWTLSPLNFLDLSQLHYEDRTEKFIGKQN